MCEFCILMLNGVQISRIQDLFISIKLKQLFSVKPHNYILLIEGNSLEMIISLHSFSELAIATQHSVLRLDLAGVIISCLVKFATRLYSFIF